MNEELYYNVFNKTVWKESDLKDYQDALVDNDGDEVESDFDLWLDKEMGLGYIMSFDQYLEGIWDAIVAAMDDDHREQIHNNIEPCSNSEFLVAYVNKYKDIDEYLYTEFLIDVDDFRKEEDKDELL